MSRLPYARVRGGRWLFCGRPMVAPTVRNWVWAPPTGRKQNESKGEIEMEKEKEKEQEIE